MRIFFKECTALHNANFNVFLMVSDGLGYDVKNGIHIISLFEKKHGRLPRMIKSYFTMLKKALLLNADIYHIHDPELIPIAIKLKSLNKKVIYDIHEDMPPDILSKYWIPFSLRKIVSLLFENYEKSRSKYFDALITATPFIKKRVEIYNSKTFNINNFPIMKEFDIIKLNQVKNQICYIGAMTKVRGLLELLDALSYCNAQSALAGNIMGPGFESELKKHKNWVKVLYSGYADRKTVHDILAKSNVGVVLLHPIVNHVNALPTKIFEYMAAGIPVVASNFPYWIELLGHRNCAVFVDPLKPEEIGAAIDDLVQDPEKAKQMGMNGKLAVQSCFNWEQEEVKLLEVYRRL